MRTLCSGTDARLARRMVRELKEKDDGGTTGGLSSAGTPHNNFCVHAAVHFRQSGGSRGVGVGNPNLRKVRSRRSVGRRAARFSSARGGGRVPLRVPPSHFVAKFFGHPAFCFESNKIAMRSEFHKAPLRQEKNVFK